MRRIFHNQFPSNWQDILNRPSPDSHGVKWLVYFLQLIYTFIYIHLYINTPFTGMIQKVQKEIPSGKLTWQWYLNLFPKGNTSTLHLQYRVEFLLHSVAILYSLAECIILETFLLQKKQSTLGWWSIGKPEPDVTRQLRFLFTQSNQFPMIHSNMYDIIHISARCFLLVRPNPLYCNLTKKKGKQKNNSAASKIEFSPFVWGGFISPPLPSTCALQLPACNRFGKSKHPIP